MKPGSSFKLKKTTKRVAATINDSQKRNSYMRLMIQSQLAEEEALRKPLKMKDKE